jgi:hypothetical protein
VQLRSSNIINKLFAEVFDVFASFHLSAFRIRNSISYTVALLSSHTFCPLSSKPTARHYAFFLMATIFYCPMSF